MIQGDITTYVAAVGHAEEDPVTQRALEFVGGAFTVDDRDLHRDGVDRKYLTSNERGVSFLFKDRSLHTVFCYAQSDGTAAQYWSPATLVDGVDFSMSMDEVVAVLGAPELRTAFYAAYPFAGRTVQFNFKDGAMTLVLAMPADPSA